MKQKTERQQKKTSKTESKFLKDKNNNLSYTNHEKKRKDSESEVKKGHYNRFLRNL